jgi:hypothetical protein
MSVVQLFHHTRKFAPTVPPLIISPLVKNWAFAVLVMGLRSQSFEVLDFKASHAIGQMP